MNLNVFSPQKENLPLFPQVCSALTEPPSGSQWSSLCALEFLMHPEPSLSGAKEKKKMEAVPAFIS